MLSRRGRACGFALAARQHSGGIGGFARTNCHLLAGNAGKPLGATRNRDVRAAPRARAHICVLAAGSPEESIPPILKTRLIPDASGVLREMPAEPLAADLRPEAKAKRKAELLRIIAAVARLQLRRSPPTRASPQAQSALPSRPWQRPSPSPPSASSPPISPNQRGGAHRGIEEPRRPGARPVRPGGDRAGHRDCASSPPLFRERH